ncbi:MAG: extracellular catalytic domain type 2 short-chain-length polyhydroxyalkanoate depolymerase [Burkholderiaceae bacterium]
MNIEKKLMNRCIALAFSVTAAAATIPAQATVVTLGRYGADATKTSVSGISSGGYMAVQAHVGMSATFKTGVAVFAGGPYYCAQGSSVTATGYCMNATSTSQIPLATLESYTNSWASFGYIDATSNLSGSKVYLFSGTSDTVVHQPVMDALQLYYQHYSSTITYNKTTAAGHGWISPYGANSCSAQTGTYINNCNIDPEQTFLGMFYGTLNAKNTGTLSGSFIEFNQKEFVPGGVASTYSLADSGWAYVPSSCATANSCKVHVVLHGCLQNYATIGNAMVTKAGVNEWADTNSIIVVYPQTIASNLSPYNPNGCWDWWGYTGSTYAQKSGAQMTFLKNIVNRITSAR